MNPAPGPRPTRSELLSSPRFVLLAGATLVVVACILELLTDRLSLTLLFLTPVFLVTWNLGRWRGTAFALASAVAWLAADLASGDYAAGSLAPLGNALTRAVVLTGVAMLVSALRDSALKERKHARLEHEAAERLRELNDLKDTLLHAVSHDLKGPMTAILGSAQMLRRAEQLGLSPGDRGELVGAIERGGHRILRLVTDLLDLDRLDRGVLMPDRRPVDLSALVLQVLGDIEEEVEVDAELDLAPITVSLDAAKIERVVDNLVRNALKHTPVGTRVHVAVRREGGGVLLVVEDEGPGVPDELKGPIFEPFAQGEGGAGAGGVGIGLSLVSRFVALHGGRAWVEDRPGGGASFRVFLPDGGQVGGAERPAPPRHLSVTDPPARTA